MGVMNGQARGAGLLAASPPPPASAIPVHHAGPASSRPQQENSSTPSRTVDGDTVIRVLAAAVVLAVAAFAAVVSYSHIFDLSTHHGQSGTAARMLPLSVDGLIAAASLVMLHAARKRLPVPLLARIALMLGVGATVAANVGYGLPFGWLSAVISAWPAVAFIVSVELAVRFVDDARRVAANKTAHDGKSAEHRIGNKSGTGAHETQREPRRDNGSGDRKLRQKRPSASDKARDMLRRNPDLDKAAVAKRAGVSVRTVERVMGEAAETATV
jgi:Protein of unknown function (DUF2637)